MENNEQETKIEVVERLYVKNLTGNIVEILGRLLVVLMNFYTFSQTNAQVDVQTAGYLGLFGSIMLIWVIKPSMEMIDSIRFARKRK